MYSRYLLIILITLDLFSQVEANENHKKGFYWYDTIEEEKLKKEKPPEKTKQNSPNVQADEKIIINSAWLRENLPKLREAAIDNPTDQNLAMHYYAQRILFDLASRFSERSKEFLVQEPALNEEFRRPTNASSLITWKDEIEKAKEKLIQSLSDKLGLFFFYRSDCPYCHKQSFSMAHLQKRTGFQVLGVSMDGKKLIAPRSDEYKHKADINGGLSRRYNISITPTLMVVDYKTQEAVPIAYGLDDYQNILENILLVAKQKGLLTEKELNKARDVKHIVAIDDVEKGIVIDKQDFEENPSILVDMLRKRLLKQTGIQNESK